MPEITFVQPDGNRRTVGVDPGTSVMQAALFNAIPGVIGECGGQLVCATCHVYVAPDKVGQLAPPNEYERDMLECTASPREPNSRLGCQVIVTEALGDITVTLPPSQV